MDPLLLLSRAPPDVATYILLFLPLPSLLSLDSLDASLRGPRQSLIPTSLWLSLCNMFADPRKLRLSFPSSPLLPPPHLAARALCLQALSEDGGGGLGGPKTPLSQASEHLYLDLLPSTTVASVSSTDRPAEAASNLLRDSPCVGFLRALGLQNQTQKELRAQMMCGCVAERACYWSSAPSKDEDMEEHVEFRTRPAADAHAADAHAVAAVDASLVQARLVQGLMVAPYQAFAHPREPTYAPKAASLDFSHPSLGTYYSSPRLPLKKEGGPQFLSLPYPALFVGTGGSVTVRLHGSQQRQTLDEDGPQLWADPGAGSRNDFYVCVARVKVYEAAEEDPGAARFGYRIKGEERGGAAGGSLDLEVTCTVPGRRGQREKRG